MKKVPIPAVHLLSGLDKQLISLLQSLSPEEWQAPTIAGQWTVKDVAAHFLNGNIRSLSAIRDNYTGDISGFQSNESLIDYLNQLNGGWVNSMKQVSPAILTELLLYTGSRYTKQLSLLDPFAPAPFPVAWAGDRVSPNWFHIAREYTEKWHHQQQIRDAVNRPGIMSRLYYYPVLDTFMMALPYTYRHTDADKQTVVQVSITGEAGGNWFLVKREKWELHRDNKLPVAAHTTIDGNIAWKLFTKSLRKISVMHAVSVTGDRQLGETVLGMVSVMA
jgi:uncharacterized protein (TIGR03083 family)